MTDEHLPELEESLAAVTVAGGALELRSEPERIISYRIMRWGELGDTPSGWEMFDRGAFEGTNEEEVYLRLDHQDPAVARGVRGSLEERADGAYMDFGPVARTARGDELLGLVRDGIYRGASVGFLPVPGRTIISRHADGRRLNRRQRVQLSEVGATWRPVFPSAGVMQVRSAEMLENQPAAATPPAPPAAPVQVAEFMPATPVLPATPVHIQRESDLLDRIMTRMESLEERARQQATGLVPAVQAMVPHLGEWTSVAIRQLAGENVPELELRALAEIVTGTNLGVVPPAYANELMGPIDANRPFLENTRELPTPESGTKLIVPRIVTRPTVGKQAAEKDELTSTNTAIDTVEYGMETIGGAGDLSLQLLRRSSPSFLDLYVRLLAEALAHMADRRGLIALLVGGIDAGGTFDPESPTYGLAYANSQGALRTPPNRIFMSSAAFAAFLDAKEPAGGGGRPMYPGLVQISSISTAGNNGPDAMVLRPVIVPELDVLKAAPPAELTDPTPDIVVPDIIIGPSNGFAWSEDGNYTLQADNPGQAGRDVALVDMIWYAATHPGAFTGYTLPA